MKKPTRSNGFGFRSFTPESLLKTIRRAGRIFVYQSQEWGRLQKRAMATDFSWDAATSRYLDVYQSVTGLSRAAKYRTSLPSLTMRPPSCTVWAILRQTPTTAYGSWKPMCACQSRCPASHPQSNQ